MMRWQNMSGRIEHLNIVIKIGRSGTHELRTQNKQRVGDI